MEAVPRLPMIQFELKVSTEPTSFGSLKRYIAECYQEDPETYSKEVFDLESLRGLACRPPVDVSGCNQIKRYYCQLHSIQSRFPLTSERQLLTFTWRDAFSSGVTQSNDIRFEMAAMLYNYGVMHTQLAAQDPRTTDDGIKLVCTHYQCAAWAFAHIREAFPQVNSGDMASDILVFMENLCLAQAQECILEKSLIDNRKPGIVAKVTAQIIAYYNQAYGSLLNISEDGSFAEILGVGNKNFRDYKAQIQFKISYLSCILLLYRGQAAEEQQKMGERVTFYQASFEKLEEAIKQSKGLKHQTQIGEMCSFVMDVVEAKRKAGKNENEFIYHEEIPAISNFSAVQGANLVKGIPFSVTDPEAAGEDIFKRLVPMKAHEASSVYSEAKADVLRDVGSRVQEKDEECQKFMSSLNVDSLKTDTQSRRLPQGLVDRCAELNAKPNAIPDLVAAMSTLAETCTEVEAMLSEIKNILAKEEQSEQSFQQQFGMGRPSGPFVELNRECVKYQEAHSKAGESNDTLRKAMGLHLNNLKMLAKPLAEIQKLVPVSQEEIDPVMMTELKSLLAKVKEMQDQRSHLFNGLRDAINQDDITSQVISWGDKKLDKLFRLELAKHEAAVAVIDQNLSAQPNILRALTECYARCAVFIKSSLDVKQKRDQFFTALATSYDVYDDLLGKSSKGLEFYKKLQGNIQKLLARVRAAHDVQDEERQQRLLSVKPTAAPKPVETVAKPDGRPRLKDYLKNGVINVNDLTLAHPLSVRPSPLGSETTTSVSCVTSTFNDSNVYSANTYTYNDPPPPYVAYNSQHNPPSASPFNPDQHMQYTSNPNQTQQLQHNYLAPPAYNQFNSGMANNDPAPAYSQTYANLAQTSLDNNRRSQTPQQQQNYAAQPTPNAPHHYQTSYTPNVYSASIATPQHHPPQQSNIYDQSTTAANKYTNASTPTETNSTVSGYTYNPYTGQYEPAAPLHQHPNPNPQLAQPSYTFDANGQQTQWNNPPQTPTAHRSSSSLSNVTTDMSNLAINQQPQTTPHNLAPSGAYQHASTTPYSGQTNSGTSYDTTTQSNYQITANVQYVTGYDQTATLHQASTGYTGHPGYEFNQQSGVYQYSSGYQSDPASTKSQNQFPQYTKAGSSSFGGNTDGIASGADQSLVGQYGVAGGNQQSSRNNYGYDSEAIQPHTKLQLHQQPRQQHQLQQQQHSQNQHWSGTSTMSNDYNQPITSHAYSSIPQQQPALHQQQTQSQYQIQQDPVQTQQQVPQQQQTQYTPSTDANPKPEYTDPVQQTQSPTAFQPSTTNSQNQVPTNIPNPSQIAAPAPKPTATSTNLDLLSGLDFSATSVPNAVLQPTAFGTAVALEPVVLKPTELVDTVKNSSGKADSLKLETKQSPSHQASATIDTLDASLNWNVTSLEKDELNAVAASMADPLVAVDFKNDPLENAETLKWFHREVERYEKNVEAMNVKTLNGFTQLDGRWKELQDLLVKDETKRTTAVSKLFPDKNRSNDSIPYDHARVRLATTTDDYINACFVRELGPGCPVFVLAQTPMSHTVKDFWSMVWSQRSRIIVCLHGPAELLDPFFPLQPNQTLCYDDFMVTMVRQFDLSHSIERSFTVDIHGSETKLETTIVQVKEWPKHSSANIVGVAKNVMSIIKQNVQANRHTIGPVVLNCISGADRSGMLALAIAAVLATCAKRPTLINAVDVWYRICSQRKGGLRDVAALELSMQVILQNAHELLNKRGIMTSYQMKNAQVEKAAELALSNDPFSDLDPLWKLK